MNMTYLNDPENGWFSSHRKCMAQTTEKKHFSFHNIRA